MELDPAKHAEIKAYEEIIRRAALINAPFMLKGSFVTRSYFPNPENRIPGDLDWVYLEKMTDPKETERIFTNWLRQIVAMEGQGSIKLNLPENHYWLMVDYAMEDDFPTVYGCLTFWDDALKTGDDLDIEISFNLPVKNESLPCAIQLLDQSIVNFPHCPTLEIQIAWKLHQCIIRPRFKDIVDLDAMFRSTSYRDIMRDKIIDLLLEECQLNKDNTFLIASFFAQDYEVLFQRMDLKQEWLNWRITPRKFGNYSASICEEIFPNWHVPKNFYDLLDSFTVLLRTKGFTQDCITDFLIQNKDKIVSDKLLYQEQVQQHKKVAMIQALNGAIHMSTHYDSLCEENVRLKEDKKSLVNEVESLKNQLSRIERKNKQEFSLNKILEEAKNVDVFKASPPKQIQPEPGASGIWVLVAIMVLLLLYFLFEI